MEGPKRLIEIRGEQLELLPEKALHWPARRTLLIADTHFGKAATFRRAGIPVPTGTTVATLARLSNCLSRTGAERLVVLGDLVHAPVRSQHDFETELLQWRQSHRSLTVELVAGNHDRGQLELFAQLSLSHQAGSRAEPPFVWCHDHRHGDGSGLYPLAGHLHPGLRVDSGGKSRMMLPCFWFTESYAVLPAFGEFTGCAPIRPQHQDQVFVVADGEIVRVQP